MGKKVHGEKGRSRNGVCCGRMRERQRHLTQREKTPVVPLERMCISLDSLGFLFFISSMRERNDRTIERIGVKWMYSMLYIEDRKESEGERTNLAEGTSVCFLALWYYMGFFFFFPFTIIHRAPYVR